MKKYFFTTILILSSFFLSLCGKKGPIYPPEIKIPNIVETFKAIQRGDIIILTWGNPATYIDGSPITEIAEVQFWIMEEVLEEGITLGSVSKEVFSEKAKILKSIPAEEFSVYQTVKEDETVEYDYIHHFKLKEFEKKRLTLAAKIIDARGKYSDLSDFIYLEPKKAPLPPREISFEVYEDKIKLKWKPPEKTVVQSIGSDLIICYCSYSSFLSIFTISLPGNRIDGYNIYRLTEGKEPERRNSSIVKNIYFNDKPFTFGSRYIFFVRASAAEISPLLESVDSDTIEVIPRDTFPPVPPKKLSAVAGDSFITLIWESNQEKDLAGYKIWRKNQGETKYQLITPELEESNSYMDSQVKDNIRYEYVITACDTSGNESERSQSVSLVITGDLHEDLPL